MIDHGEGPARGLSAATRVEVLEAMRVMTVRNPRMLARMATTPTPNTVCDLIAYARERKVSA
jgi:hypothetical protein